MVAAARCAVTCHDAAHLLPDCACAAFRWFSSPVTVCLLLRTPHAFALYALFLRSGSATLIFAGRRTVTATHSTPPVAAFCRRALLV